MRIVKPAIRIAAAGAALLAAAPGVLAQGCPMCYTEAAAQNPVAQRHLNYAILTLLVPSVLMFGGVLFAAFRRKGQDPVGVEQLRAQYSAPSPMTAPEPIAHPSPSVPPGKS